MTTRSRKKNKSLYTSTNEYEFFGDTGDLLGRLGAQSEAEFNEENARQALVALETNKPLCHCKVYCYNDRLQYKKLSTFGAKPPKKFHKYKDILRFYVFSSDQRVIVLCVQEPPLRKYYFECLKLRDTNDVNKVCDLILLARRDPEYILRRNGNVNNRALSETRTVTNNINNNNVIAQPAFIHNNYSKNLNNQKLIVDDYTTYDGTNRGRPVYSYKRTTYDPATGNTGNNNNNNNITGDKVYYTQEPRTSNYPISDTRSASELVPRRNITTIDNTHRFNNTEIPRTEEYLYTPRVEKTKLYGNEDNSMRRAISNPHLDDDAWAVDVKYIDSDPKYGSRISENGPVYMFIAHHLSPDRKVYSALSNNELSTNNSPVIRPKSAFASKTNLNAANNYNNDNINSAYSTGINANSNIRNNTGYTSGGLNYSNNNNYNSNINNTSGFNNNNTRNVGYSGTNSNYYTAGDSSDWCTQQLAKSKRTPTSYEYEQEIDRKSGTKITNRLPTGNW